LYQQGGFGTALMTKDLGLSQDAATTTKSATPLGSLAHQVCGGYILVLMIVHVFSFLLY